LIPHIKLINNKICNIFILIFLYVSMLHY